VKQKKYTIRKISVGILSIFISTSSLKVGTAKALMDTDNKVIVDENGVRPVVEPIPSGNKTPVKKTDKPVRKPLEKSEDKLEGKPVRKPPVKQTEKLTEKLVNKPSDKPDRKPLVEPKEDKTSVKKDDDNKFSAMSDKEKYHDVNNSPNKDLLFANLSGHDIKVEYKKGSISADKLHVESLNDNKLNKSIKNKLGNNYKIIETFEIHFEKDDKKVDSNEERTVKIAITKKDNTELEVYHIPNDNSLEKVNSKYSDGELQFNINHFSKFTIVERIKIGTKNLEERAQVVIPETTVDVKKEELPETLAKKINNLNEISSLPKTGIKTVALEVVGVMLILAAILIRRGQKKN
jgi:S-layer protein